MRESHFGLKRSDIAIRAATIIILEWRVRYFFLNRNVIQVICLAYVTFFAVNYSRIDPTDTHEMIMHWWTADVPVYFG